MIKQIVISVAAVIAITPTAFAYTTLGKTASPVASIIQGHGNPGDTASSMSDPDVSVRVLESGKVERKNTRYGTVTIIDPRAESVKNNRR
ncbi:hypothetical protein RvVAT039_pl12480 (plasmid) [Agrobacterium vitis]|uniref:DUF680 domain-containing protein n=1 Tax=Agrobacterium vitis TaxID=373 RepID=A0ABW9TJA5_AGRVI|nr:MULTISPECIES: hypothetical protein [Rhizobium/Agrobacterium group]MCF1450815.1 hypothetical protein [Allorhizobium ampelinum]MCF1469863.1 hypothetical protein [Agrobacterium vitis]MUO44671.1 hypothetical protein [Agrobacterium vitis]BCH62704.1 hypothetical protein RvVAR0630_pl08460 [Agrobacterium vitis]BCH68415.1 hypothetical protein RvVAT039_pl12480 [Agrobacterium vitis]